MEAIFIGILGSVFIIFSWVYETYEAVKKHKSLIDLKFAVFYIIGITITTEYCYLERIMLFFYLNVILLIFVSAEIAYTFYAQRIRKKSREK